ncbi:MAG: anti-sigma F factor [Clostridiales Family XIII bacterium]|nr:MULTISPECIES: anti-sigma F factor [Eubacteriales Family XIII. Incertae Sedis]MDE8733776.1 anti-sigma F factor [Eubacteriales bacterium DFI.9.88]MDY3010796.1 anti-sigma F factor [Clostridiales Family XIII bacterium]
MKIEFAAMAQNEAFARSAAAAFVACMDPTIEELTEIKTGVSEAVSNSIIHGYKEDSSGTVELECQIREGGKVVIVVRDHGVGIEDVDKAREPMFTTGRTEERSGMGFTVMESFMDRLEVESRAGEGTTVTMTKQLDLSDGI